MISKAMDKFRDRPKPPFKDRLASVWMFCFLGSTPAFLVGLFMMTRGIPGGTLVIILAAVAALSVPAFAIVAMIYYGYRQFVLGIRD